MSEMRRLEVSGGRSGLRKRWSAKPRTCVTLRAETGLLHDTAGGIGAVWRELPVAVIAVARKGLGVRVARNRHFVRKLAEFLGRQAEDFCAIPAREGRRWR